MCCINSAQDYHYIDKNMASSSSPTNSSHPYGASPYIPFKEPSVSKIWKIVAHAMDASQPQSISSQFLEEKKRLQTLLNIFINLQTDIDDEDLFGETILSLAIRVNNLGVVNFALQKGANPSKPNGVDVFPIHIAAQTSLPLCETLYKNGANMNQIDGLGYTVGDRAYRAPNGERESIQKFLNSLP